ncbi:Pre-mRNA-splicing factor ISY1 [Plasmodiophora brassicae]
MARNEEKAQSMLNRWLAYKRGDTGPVKDRETRRPFLASQCDNVASADKWRKQVLREISQAITRVQNGSIGEHRIRDMNDQINRLLEEKRQWEVRCKQLGGPDYARGPAVTDVDGKVVRGHGGYMYFGAARNLPGVRELLEKQASLHEQETRRDIHLMNLKCTPEYLGMYEDLTARLEAQAEREAWPADCPTIDEALANVVHTEQTSSLPSEEELHRLLLQSRKAHLLQQLAQT